MLNPQEREVFLDALRPDPGSVLDRAVGTSFTLDLDALLLVPLAFALFESDGSTPDPTALLAAIQQNASHLALYCDAAHIKAPARDQKLFVLLESSLLPILAPRRGVVHPKLWVLRFRSVEGEMRHRVLVLSRNLTFDTSWDLLVRFDEESSGAKLGNDVAAVLRGLDALSGSPITRSIASSVAGVRFAVPEPFDEARLYGLGLDRRVTFDPITVAPGDRVLVVSPFLSVDRLHQLRALGERHRTLVSRPDELTRIGSAAVDEWGTPLVLRATQGWEATDAEAAGLAGLHAKLYVVDRGERTTWFMGSANATGSAVARNVETVVQLVGPRTKAGVGVLLSEGSNEVRFRTLLEEFPVLETEPAERTPEELEESRLEEIARDISRLRLDARVRTEGDGYRLDLTFHGNIPPLRRGDRVYARLVTRTLEERTQLNHTPAASLVAARSSEITSLVALRLTGDTSLAAPRELVLAARLLDAPEDRAERLLIDLIPDQRRFALLLFLMLAAGDPDADTATEARHLVATAGSHVASDYAVDIPLFEALVRTSARDPQRLAAIDTLVTRLRRSPEGRERLPDGFDELWSSFVPLIERDRR